MSRHALAVTSVVVALVGTASVFVFARPGYHPIERKPKHEPLPYTKVTFDVAAARRAFRAEGIVLTPRSHSLAITTIGNRRDILEVDVFGDPALLKKYGFEDVITDAQGNYVHIPRDCTGSNRLAERWHGNVRVIVRCTTAGDGQRWLRRVERAFSHLA